MKFKPNTIQSFKHLFLLSIVATLFNPWSVMAADQEELTLYSTRKTHLIKPLLDRFTAQTGVKVNLLTGKPKALIERLRTEGSHTPADLFLTTDAGNLFTAKQADLLQPVRDETLEKTVPAHLRDKNFYWYGLSKRFRVIVYAKDRLTASDAPSYDHLADKKFKGRVCMRSSGNIYNQSLLASIIAHKGEAAALAWAKGVAENFARDPKGNDRAQITDIASKICDVSVVNTYYIGIMMSDAKNSKQQKAVAQIGIVFPNQKSSGTHVNVSGIGVTAVSKKQALATRLIRFLTATESQTWYAETNHEYPIRSDVKPSALVKSFGANFKEDALIMDKLGELNKTAVIVYDKARWR